MKNKVPENEFHMTLEELEDGILRAAELIKEGYELYSYKYDTPEHYLGWGETGPFFHVVFKRGHYE